MLISVLSVSTAAIVIRQAQKEVPSLTIAAYRLGIAAVIMASYALLFRRDEIRQLTTRKILLIIVSGILLALHFGTWITSLEYTTVTSSVVLVSLSSLWVALLSIVILKEKMTWLLWVGLSLSLLGSILITGSSPTGISIISGEVLFSRNMIGNGLAFSGAWFLAGYLIIGRKLRSALSLSSYIFLIFGVASLVLFAGALFFHDPIVGFKPINYLYLLFLAIVPQLLGHAAFNWALKYLSATFVSIALLGEPIGAAIFALVLLKEPPTIFEVAGGTLILIGIFISSRGSR
jgi:drug/metabolite transporter (DMT)-like permease